MSDGTATLSPNPHTTPQGDEEWAHEPQLNVALAEHAKRNGGLSQLALGGLHTAAVLGSGQLLTWGHGGFGALGQGGCGALLPPIFIHLTLPTLWLTRCAGLGRKFEAG